MRVDDWSAESLDAWWAAQEKPSWYERNWPWFDKTLICAALALIWLATGWVIG